MIFTKIPTWFDNGATCVHHEIRSVDHVASYPGVFMKWSNDQHACSC